MEGVAVLLHSSLISAPDLGEWSTLRPGRFTPKGKELQYPLIIIIIIIIIT